MKLRFLFALLAALTATTNACTVADNSDSAEGSESAARVRKPVDAAEPFPSTSTIRSALDLYGRDQGAARADGQIGVSEFFGES